MEPHILVPPNLNGKVYREFIPQQKHLNTFLDFIDINNDQVLLGSSNLNGRYWDGSICYYKDIDTKQQFDIENTTYSVECLDVGVTDGKILPNNNKVIIAQDSGEIKLFDIEENLKLIKVDTEEHEEYITELSLIDDVNFITSSADACIKLWSIKENDIACVHTYNYALSNIISSVCANTLDSNLFASCSFDRTALLWDKRINEMGKIIYQHEFCALTKIDWHPTKSNIIAISNSSGDVYLVDIREPKEFLAKNSCFDRSIHKIRFNSEGLLAVCADDAKLVVLDCANNEDMKVVYIDEKHSDFIRGLAWQNNTLLTCGWDKQVYLHYL